MDGVVILSVFILLEYIYIYIYIYILRLFLGITYLMFRFYNKIHTQRKIKFIVLK